ncbi:flavodoxin family protein [Marvinbryantia formatexigens]|nr:flavodoxin family protein [Marvinbryantia formatexigens]
MGEKMSLLIINTLEKNDPLAKEAIRNLSAQTSLYTIFHTMEMKIAPCIGCNACWLKTPGICAIKDDYEKILKACLQHDTTIIISDTSLGFINYKAKNIVDRMLPLATMYTHIINGQMRHIPRYEKKFQFGIVYSGVVDMKYMEQWLERFALNFNGVSIGAFPIEKCGEVSLCT